MTAIFVSGATESEPISELTAKRINAKWVGGIEVGLSFNHQGFGLKDDKICQRDFITEKSINLVQF